MPSFRPTPKCKFGQTIQVYRTHLNTSVRKIRVVGHRRRQSRFDLLKAPQGSSAQQRIRYFIADQSRGTAQRLGHRPEGLPARPRVPLCRCGVRHDRRCGGAEDCSQIVRHDGPCTTITAVAFVVDITLLPEERVARSNQGRYVPPQPRAWQSEVPSCKLRLCSPIPFGFSPCECVKRNPSLPPSSCGELKWVKMLDLRPQIAGEILFSRSTAIMFICMVVPLFLTSKILCADGFQITLSGRSGKE